MRIQSDRREEWKCRCRDRFQRSAVTNSRRASDRAAGLAGDFRLKIGDIVRAGMEFEDTRAVRALASAVLFPQAARGTARVVERRRARRGSRSAAVSSASMNPRFPGDRDHCDAVFDFLGEVSSPRAVAHRVNATLRKPRPVSFAPRWSWRAASRPDFVSEYTFPWRTSPASGVMARRVSPRGAQ